MMKNSSHYCYFKNNHVLDISENIDESSHLFPSGHGCSANSTITEQCKEFLSVMYVKLRNILTSLNEIKVILIVEKYDMNTYELCKFFPVTLQFLTDEKKLASIVFYIEYIAWYMVSNITH